MHLNKADLAQAICFSQYSTPVGGRRIEKEDLQLSETTREYLNPIPYPILCHVHAMFTIKTRKQDKHPEPPPT